MRCPSEVGGYFLERGAIFCHCSDVVVEVIDGRWVRTMLKVAPSATGDESIGFRYPRLSMIL
jgi:hypothetical protein